ncbi:hypothetical protein B0H11DRAFT_898120 [Mycena galericulata]|nr:hypothetical protein B0H11DRAFT_898120 [Mycena galericulata]
MVASTGYRPRVPPFNTVMQLYTTTKLNRKGALFPRCEYSAHRIYVPTSYSWTPMDASNRSKSRRWSRSGRCGVHNDPAVEIQGNHFASLINAYAACKKDLDKVVAVFSSTPAFPHAPPRDTLVFKFEAMINTLVAHHRTDLAHA